MDIVSDSDDDFVSPSGSVVLSRGSSTITGQDGSKHIVPRINKKALHYLTSRKTNVKSSSKASTGTSSSTAKTSKTASTSTISQS